jgi:D-aminopeptidase
MMCFDWKGGIGSASRRVSDAGHTVGVLVLANFGSREELRVDGVPVGRLLGGAAATGPPTPAGSCIAIVATDAPLASSDLTRLARRAGLGLGRTGSAAHHGSGEIFLAFSTAPSVEAVDYDPLFGATVDATEEAVLNVLWNAERTVGRDGRVAEALPRDEVLALLEAHGRLPP